MEYRVLKRIRTGRVSNADATALVASAEAKHSKVRALDLGQGYSLDDRRREDGQELESKRDEKNERDGRRRSYARHDAELMSGAWPIGAAALA